GYYRYLEMYDPENPAKLIEEIKSDISTTYRRNIERDEMAIANSGGRAFFPYLSTDFVELALAAPISYKISPDDEPSRKRLLRELALSMGLPLELGSVPKKATQYSSGSSNILVDSVRNNVPNLSDFGRNRAGRRVQEVLDAIGFKLGIPSTREEQSSLEIDMAATDTFLKDLESEISID
ncbi:MAG: asparagine synthase C-terminal domain-containing protein, partial [Candidatus Thorarchaeota archaeon]